jgi:FkbM family methyltransferase
MRLSSALLPDGRTVHCVNTYEVDFSAHEIFNEDLSVYGLDMPADGVYLDVGANIGLFSLYIMDKCPQATVFAFEPMPSAFAALERNKTEFAPSVVPFLMGLGASPGAVEFDYYPAITALSTCRSATGVEMAGGIAKLLFSADPGEAMGRILDKTGATELRDDADFAGRLFRVEKVQARIDTVSNQIALLGIGRIDLLKIDTEGSEREVLAGIAEADWPKIRQLLVEVHLGKEELETIAGDLGRRGFRTLIGDHPMSQGGASVFHIYATRAGVPELAS